VKTKAQEKTIMDTATEMFFQIAWMFGAVAYEVRRKTVLGLSKQKAFEFAWIDPGARVLVGG